MIPRFPALSHAFNFRRWVTIALLLAPAIGGGSGCATHRPAADPTGAGQPVGRKDQLRVGDELQVRLDTPARGGDNTGPQLITVVIDEHGEISLPLVGRIPAAGSTPSELAERIEANYVPRFYVRSSANVSVAARFFYVGGEIRGPGRFPWTEDVTVLKAVNTAGGFTEYANRSRIEILRGDQKIAVDFEKVRRNPADDVPLRPGDSIWVPRSIF